MADAADDKKAFNQGIKGLIEAGLSARNISARKASIDVAGYDTLIRDIRKDRLPSPDKLAALMRYLGYEFYVGPPLDPAPQADVEGERLALIPRYDAQGAAGAGIINLDAPPLDRLAFPHDWLASQGLRAANSFLMTVRGDSMAPTLHDGDLIMVDRGRRELRSGRIYVYTDPEDGTRIKRIHADAGGMVIRSDNPAVSPVLEIITEPARADALLAGILGEVVWAGHRF